jgi:outer membrane receptor for ferrienterochelin and colicins
MNLAFSKDILKDKATISINANDVFNTRKMIRDLQLPNVNSDTEMQFRVRQINLNFTYRFNKKKADKEPQKRTSEGGDEMMG